LSGVFEEDKTNRDASKILAKASSTFKQKTRTYTSNGKIDPFRPLFKEKPDKQSNQLTPQLPDRKEVTALEKLNLNQLKLTGIIFASNRKFALVQETSGKGHIVSIGTFIGNRGGSVSDIQKNKVVIQETLVDVYGNTVIQKSELKLRNNPTV
jgi:type IV pilus assembly protein PilP